MGAFPKVGEIFDGRYELLEIIGTGGQSTVFKADQIDCRRRIALKILNPDLADDEEFRQRFLREARALSLLSHAGIVTIYHIAVSRDGQPYMVMELVRGCTVKQRLAAEGPFSQAAALKIANLCADALGHVHDNGIVHRDLKPDNIILVNEPEPDSVKLIDFGLARLQEAKQQKLTATGTILGSVFYMSPEQCRGDRADCRSDIYSLCACLYEMLTARKPFTADNPMGLMYKHLNSAVPQIEKGQLASFDQRINQLLARGMAKTPEMRYQSMSELSADLTKISQTSNDPGGALQFTNKKQTGLPPSSVSGSKRLLLFALVCTSVLTASILLSRHVSSLKKDPQSSANFIWDRACELEVNHLESERTKFVAAVLQKIPAKDEAPAGHQLMIKLAGLCTDFKQAEACYARGNVICIERAYLLLALGDYEKSLEMYNLPEISHMDNEEKFLVHIWAAIRSNKPWFKSQPTDLWDIDTNTLPAWIRALLASRFSGQLQSFLEDAHKRISGHSDGYEPLPSREEIDGLTIALIVQIAQPSQKLRQQALGELHTFLKKARAGPAYSDLVLLDELIKLESDKTSDAVKVKLITLTRRWLTNIRSESIPKVEDSSLLPSTVLSSLIEHKIYTEADRVLRTLGYYSFRPVKATISQNFEERAMTSVLLSHRNELPVQEMLAKITESRRRNL